MHILVLILKKKKIIRLYKEKNRSRFAKSWGIPMITRKQNEYDWQNYSKTIMKRLPRYMPYREVEKCSIP